MASVKHSERCMYHEQPGRVLNAAADEIDMHVRQRVEKAHGMSFERRDWLLRSWKDGNL